MNLLGILLGILELLILGPPITFIYGLPLLLTGLVWAGGAILGGVLGGALAGPEGVLPGSVLGAGVMAGTYSGALSRHAGSFGLGAGWRYWKTNHISDLAFEGPFGGRATTWSSLPPNHISGLAFEEPFSTPRISPQNGPRPLEVLLDVAAACSLAALTALAGGWAMGCLAGALTFGAWGGAWGLYLGATQPRSAQRPMDLQAACPANFCCPWGAPWYRFSIRWALGCSIGYGMQALLLGALPGLVCGQLFLALAAGYRSA